MPRPKPLCRVALSCKSLWGSYPPSARTPLWYEATPWHGEGKISGNWGANYCLVKRFGPTTCQAIKNSNCFGLRLSEMFALKSHWWGQRLSLVPLNTCQVFGMSWMAVPHGDQSHARKGRVCKKRLQETTRGHHKGFVENISVAKITVLEAASTTWRAWKLTDFWWNMQKQN